YASVSDAGIYKSVDGGATWKPSGAGLPDVDAKTNLNKTTVRSLIIDSKTPTTLYAATSSGVFKSADSGMNWSANNAGLASNLIAALAIDPIDPKKIYAGIGAGAGDAFVVKLKADGSALDYFTFLGGGDSDVGAGITVSAANTVYVTGSTSSSNFPISANA